MKAAEARDFRFAGGLVLFLGAGEVDEGSWVGVVKREPSDTTEGVVAILKMCRWTVLTDAEIGQMEKVIRDALGSGM